MSTGTRSRLDTAASPGIRSSTGRQKSPGIRSMTEDQADTTGVTVNELGLQGHGVTHADNDAGRHYLVVNSECPWSLTAVAQP
jgi:hypothetical protein